MSSPLVPIAMAGVLVYLASSSKKKTSKPSGSGKLSYKKPKNVEIPNLYGGLVPTGSSKDYEPPSSSNWMQRQEALTYISQVSFHYGDKEIFICAKCDPKGIDGKVGRNTRNAVKAFQALTGLTVTGEWGANEDRAMKTVFTAIQNGTPLPCDPLNTYPAPLGCFQQPDGSFGLMPSFADVDVSKPATEPMPKPDSAPVDPTEPPPESSKYGPGELLVADGDCNFILHIDDQFFVEQKKLIIASALEGLTDDQAVDEIQDEIVQRYIPMCGLLGRNGVGQGVRTWWDQNVAHIASSFKTYELSPDTLEEDAIQYGLL